MGVDKTDEEATKAVNVVKAWLRGAQGVVRDFRCRGWRLDGTGLHNT